MLWILLKHISSLQLIESAKFFFSVQGWKKMQRLEGIYSLKLMHVLPRQEVLLNCIDLYFDFFNDVLILGAA